MSDSPSSARGGPPQSRAAPAPRGEEEAPALVTLLLYPSESASPRLPQCPSQSTIRFGVWYLWSAAAPRRLTCRAGRAPTKFRLGLLRLEDWVSVLLIPRVLTVGGFFSVSLILNFCVSSIYIYRAEFCLHPFGKFVTSFVRAIIDWFAILCQMLYPILYHISTTLSSPINGLTISKSIPLLNQTN